MQDQINENPHAETTVATTERLYHFNHHIITRTRQISRQLHDPCVGDPTHGLIFRSNQELPANQIVPMEDTEIFWVYNTSKDQFSWVSRFCKSSISVLSSTTNKKFTVPWGTCSSAAANPVQIWTFSVQQCFSRIWKVWDSVDDCATTYRKGDF